MRMANMEPSTGQMAPDQGALSFPARNSASSTPTPSMRAMRNRMGTGRWASPRRASPIPMSQGPRSRPKMARIPVTESRAKNGQPEPLREEVVNAEAHPGDGGELSEGQTLQVVPAGGHEEDGRELTGQDEKSEEL